jgi:hypothetical protein
MSFNKVRIWERFCKQKKRWYHGFSKLFCSLCIFIYFMWFVGYAVFFSTFITVPCHCTLIAQFDDESPKLTINYLISYTVAHISGCCMEKWIMKYGRWFHNYRVITYMLESVGRWTCQDILFSPSSPTCDLVIFSVSATALVLLFYHIWLLKWKRKPYLSFISSNILCRQWKG